MKKEEKLKHCLGCEDDFYNGKNPLGVKECWMLKQMTLQKRKKVHVDQVPPWTQKPGIYPSCYRQRRYVFINCETEDRQR